MSELLATRSTPLRARRTVRLAIVALVLMATATAYQLLWRQHVKRFQVIRPGVLYRVAQPSEWGMRYLVRRHGVKTVLNLRLEDDHLRRGVLAVGAPTGDVESRFVEELGIHHLQWAMGREACWPWVSPGQFEEFFRLFDNPDNLPIAVHCVSGRHRTGTIAALYRLEYDHWPIERVLAEMYSFSFGAPIPLQEMNLRTYVPRPEPTPTEWASLLAEWGEVVGTPPADYAALVRHLRADEKHDVVRSKLIEQLTAQKPFALSLARRLIDSPDDPVASAAADAADHCLSSDEQSNTSAPSPLVGEGRVRGKTQVGRHSLADLQSAAALIADFGTADQQQQLLAMLRTGAAEPQANPLYQSLIAGIANRYTGNRVPFLTVLLDDPRPMSGTGDVTVRYCDLAVVRLSAILDQRLINVGSSPTAVDWEQARLTTKVWLSEHPQVARLGRLSEPTGHPLLR